MWLRLYMPIPLKELLARTFREVLDDDALGIAAQLAYYFFLALFPTLLFLIALASLFPLQDFTGEVVRFLQPFAPQSIIDVIREQMVKLGESDDSGLLSLGLLGAVWSSSAAMVSICGALNRAYDIEESRPWWKVRLTAIFLTLGLGVFILLSFTLIIVGPEMADLLASRFGLGEVFAWTWKVLQWPIAFALVAFGLALVYYFAPDADQDWVWITPGSIVATLLWIVVSLGFRIYIVNFGSYEASYGAVGAVIVLLLWFYLSGLVIVIGAELNSEIEHASPWGKKPGEKVPGQRRTIGALAEREWTRSPSS